MLVYTIIFGLLSIGSVRNDVWNQYHIAFIIWDAVCFGLIFTGNMIYSLDYISPIIRKLWKLIFPIVILQIISGAIEDFIYGKNINHEVASGCIAWTISFVLFIPTIRAHYLIGYGNEVNVDDAD